MARPQHEPTSTPWAGPRAHRRRVARCPRRCLRKLLTQLFERFVRLRDEGFRGYVGGRRLRRKGRVAAMTGRRPLLVDGIAPAARLERQRRRALVAEFRARRILVKAERAGRGAHRRFFASVIRKLGKRHSPKFGARLGPATPERTPLTSARPARARRAAPRGALSPRAVGDLVPAARAVGDDQRVAVPPRGRPAAARAPPCASTRRSARHRSRSCPPCRSSSTRRARRRAPGRASSTSRGRCTASNAFWWQWPCSSAALLRQRAKRERAAVPALLARQELLDQERPLREALRVLAEPHHEKLVAQRQQARRLEADDRRRRAARAAASAATTRARFALRLVDQPGSEVRAAAAQRPRRLARPRRPAARRATR